MMNERDIIRAAAAADMPDLERVRREILVSGGKRRGVNRRHTAWLAVSAAAMLVLAAGVYMLADDRKVNGLADDRKVNGFIPSLHPFETAVDSRILDTTLYCDIRINDFGSNMVSQSLDADCITLNMTCLTGLYEYTYVEKAVLPEGMTLSDVSAIYTRKTPSSSDYDVLHDYVFTYFPCGEDGPTYDSSVTIAMSRVGKPLRDCYISSENDVISHIGSTELKIYGGKGTYIATFQYDGVSFDVEASNITEGQLTALLCSIVVK